MKKALFTFGFLTLPLLFGCGMDVQPEIRGQGVGVESWDGTRDARSFPDERDASLADVHKLAPSVEYELISFSYSYVKQDGEKVFFERVLKTPAIASREDKLTIRAAWPTLEEGQKPLIQDTQINLPFRIYSNEKSETTFETRHYHWLRVSSDDSWEWRSFPSNAGTVLMSIFDKQNQIKIPEVKETPESPQEVLNVYRSPNVRLHQNFENMINDRPVQFGGRGSVSVNGDILKAYFEFRQSLSEDLNVEAIYKKKEKK